MRQPLTLIILALLTMLLTSCSATSNKLRTPHQAATNHASFVPLNCLETSETCIVGIPTPAGSNPLILIGEALNIKKPAWVEVGEREYYLTTKHLSVYATSVPEQPGWWAFTVAKK